MKPGWTLAFVVVLLGLPGLVLADPAATTQLRADSVNDLGWMAGCWVQHDGDKTIEEQWLAPSGGIMLETGRTVNAGVLRDYEFTRIQVVDGVLTFTADPANQPEASFKAVTHTAGEVVFENLGHDFPQHVGYRQVAGGLQAWIDGPVNGETKTITFDYQRCS